MEELANTPSTRGRETGARWAKQESNAKKRKMIDMTGDDDDVEPPKAPGNPYYLPPEVIRQKIQEQLVIEEQARNTREILEYMLSREQKTDESK